MTGRAEQSAEQAYVEPHEQEEHGPEGEEHGGHVLEIGQRVLLDLGLESVRGVVAYVKVRVEVRHLGAGVHPAHELVHELDRQVSVPGLLVLEVEAVADEAHALHAAYLLHGHVRHVGVVALGTAALAALAAEREVERDAVLVVHVDAVGVVLTIEDSIGHKIFLELSVAHHAALHCTLADSLRAQA